MAEGTTAAWLMSGQWIQLIQEPRSANAQTLTETVVSVMRPHLQNTRKIGTKAIPRMTAETGMILAGVLPDAFKNRPVSAHRRPGATLWHNSPIGGRAFWTKAEALRQAGLLGFAQGVRMPSDDGGFTGRPAKVWATDLLIKLAADAGVTAATVERDWRVSRVAEVTPITVAERDLVTVKGFDDRPVGIQAGQADLAARHRDTLVKLNALAARANVGGCLMPAFRRTFRHDLRLGGRSYAVGGLHFQQMAKKARKAITIGGTATVELDLGASFLSIFLGLTGTTTLPAGDLYAIGGLPRDVVKAWFTQTFGQGYPVKQWARKPNKAPPTVRPTVVRAAVFQAYPAFQEPLTRILPVDLMELPEKHREKAVGQFLVGVEASIIDGVLGHFLALGKLALPMHDGIICRTADRNLAVADLQMAFQVATGVIPGIK